MPNWTKEQKQAIDLEGSNILVSAGAGSGKTAVLSERVLRKVKDGVSVDDILVLTFTNAAAKEMKERIRNNIQKAGIAEQLEKIDSAYITTFDSFALSVVKKYHYLIDVSSDIAITDASVLTLKKKKILDNVFEDFFFQNDENFLRLIDSYSLKDTNEIKNFIMEAQSKLDLLYKRDNYLNNYDSLFFSESYVDNLYQQFLTLLKNKLENIKNYLEELTFLDAGDYYNSLIFVFNPVFMANNYTEIKNNIGFDFPRIPKNSSDEVKLVRDKIKNELEAIKKLCRYESDQNIKSSILKTRDNVLAIIMVIKEFNTRLDKIKKAENLYEFTDIAKLAIKIVEEHELARNYYKNKFNEILIDEYQDTSDLQDLFIKQIENNNVYMVGDIKQSIYRFRNANPKLFIEKYECYSKNNGGQKIDLNKNFRSREEVINNINLIFDFIMDQNLGGADYRNTSRLVFGNNVYNDEGKISDNSNLEILNYEYDKSLGFYQNEVEIFAVAQDIKNKIDNKYKVYDRKLNTTRACNYSDFAIIMDRSTDFDLFKKIFEYLNLPLTILKEESISSSVDIKIIKNIVKMLIKIANKKFDIDFWYTYFSIARSYLFNIEDEKIFDDYVNKNYQDSPIYKTCLLVTKDAYNDSIYSILNNIIKHFKFYEKMIRVGDVNSHIALLDYLLDLTKSLQDNYGIEEYYEYLDNITGGNIDIKFNVQTASLEGIKIMTIHKSKGLEYPICYFCGLYKPFNIRELNNKFIYDNKYGFIIPCLNDGLKSTILKDLLKENYIKEEISEKIRLFYVALTRAREKMIFVADLKEKQTLNSDLVIKDDYRLATRSFLDFLSLIYKSLKPYLINIDVNKLALTKDYNLSLQKFTNDFEDGNFIETLDFKMPLDILDQTRFSKSMNKLKTLEDKKKLQQGLDIHSIMENMNLLNPNYDIVPSNYLEYVKAFIESSVLKGVINYYQEYEFIYETDNNIYHGIIDLLLEYEDHFLIVDYKLKNTMDDAYKDQLKGYKNYLKTITCKDIDVVLYSFLDKEFTKVSL